MLSYHVNTNVILVEAFQSCHDRHRLAIANCLISLLYKRGHTVDLQILNNKCSEA